MTRRGRPPKNPDVRQVEEITVPDVGDQFERIARRLDAAAASLAALPPGAHYIDPNAGEIYADTPAEVAALDQRYTDALSGFMSELGAVRDDVEYWTRVTAEYAARGGFSHRAIGDALGVAPSTITRWIANPVGFNWDDVE